MNIKDLVTFLKKIFWSISSVSMATAVTNPFHHMYCPIENKWLTINYIWFSYNFNWKLMNCLKKFTYFWRLRADNASWCNWGDILQPRPTSQVVSSWRAQTKTVILKIFIFLSTSNLRNPRKKKKIICMKLITASTSPQLSDQTSLEHLWEFQSGKK